MRTVLITMALGVFLAACGGASTPDDPPVTVFIQSIQALDGTVDQLGGVDATSSGARAGDDAANANLRGFYAFDLSSIPAGSSIQSVQLQTYLWQVQGDPYTPLGNVVLDVVDIGAALDASDYSALSNLAGFAILSGNATLGLRSVDVTFVVATPFSMGQRRFDFRLRCEETDDPDSSADNSAFQDGELNGSPPATIGPQLQVVFLRP